MRKWKRKKNVFKHYSYGLEEITTLLLRGSFYVLFVNLECNISVGIKQKQNKRK